MENSIYYVLEGKTPRPVSDVKEWALSFEKANRHIAETSLRNGTRISTVFLGIDHRNIETFRVGEPILFETMIFGGKHDQHQDRYRTWSEAEAGHLESVKLAMSD